MQPTSSLQLPVIVRVTYRKHESNKDGDQQWVEGVVGRPCDLGEIAMQRPQLAHQGGAQDGVVSAAGGGKLLPHIWHWPWRQGLGVKV